MGQYDIPLKYRTVIKGLKKLGLKNKGGSKHDKFECPTTGNSTMVSRHVVLNKFTAGSILQFLSDNGYSDEDIEKAFKIKLHK